MAKTITVPGEGDVEFPDSMSDDDIANAIQQHVAQPAPAAAPTNPTDSQSFWAGVKDFPHAVSAIGTVPSLEDFEKYTKGNNWYAMGLVTAAGAAGVGALGAGKIAGGVAGKIAARRSAREAAEAAEAAPKAPSTVGYSEQGTVTGAMKPTYVQPAPPSGAPAAPATPPASTLWQRLRTTGGTPMERTSTVAREVLPYVEWVPGPLGKTVAAVKLGANALHRLFGWSEGGSVLNKMPSRDQVLNSLRRR